MVIDKQWHAILHLALAPYKLTFPIRIHKMLAQKSPIQGYQSRNYKYYSINKKEEEEEEEEERERERERERESRPCTCAPRQSYVRRRVRITLWYER